MFSDPSGMVNENEIAENISTIDSHQDIFSGIYNIIMLALGSIFSSGGGSGGGSSGGSFISPEAMAERQRDHTYLAHRGEAISAEKSGSANGGGDEYINQGGGLAAGGGNTTVTPDGALLPRSAKGTLTPTYNPSGNERTRSDGSKYFTKPHEAFAYMISVQKGGKEAFGVIFEKGVLVLPTHNNTETLSTPERSGYSITDGVLDDPLNEFDKKIMTTVHTHPDDGNPSVTGDGDIQYVKIHNPGNYWFVLGIGDNQIFTFINHPNWDRGRVGNISKDNNIFVSDLTRKIGANRFISICKRIIN